MRTINTPVRIAAGLLATITLVGAAGCARTGGGESSDVRPVSREAGAPQATGAPDATRDSGDTSGRAGAAPSAGQPPGQTVKAKPGWVATEGQRQVIRAGSMAITQADVQAGAAKASSLAIGMGGYESAGQSGSDDRGRITTIQTTFRIPAASFDKFRTELRKLGTVTSENLQSTDVTQQVVDLESRIKTQRESINRIRLLLAKATTVDEIVKIESELTTRQADLESLQAQLKQLASQAAMSTLAVTFTVPGITVEPPPPERDKGFLSGLQVGWNAFIKMVEWVSDAVGAALPFLILITLLAMPTAWWLRRRSRQRPPKQGPAQPAAPAPASQGG